MRHTRLFVMIEWAVVRCRGNALPVYVTPLYNKASCTETQTKPILTTSKVGNRNNICIFSFHSQKRSGKQKKHFLAQLPDKRPAIFKYE